MKEKREWVFECMELRIAMVSWGQSTKSRVLLLHGHGDSAATFEPLVNLLPDDYFYVSFDFPGHGKSDFLSAGPLPTHTLFLEVMRRVIQHLKWRTFICMGHSMGGVLAILHDNLHPGQITKLVCIDPLYALLRYINMADHHNKYVSLMCYEPYYDFVYHRFGKPTISTYEEAMTYVMKHRKMTRDHAGVVLSRNLTPLEDGLFKVSPQKAAFQTAHIPATFDIIEHIFTNITIPILIFHTSQTLALYETIEGCSNSVRRYDNKSSLYKVVSFEGSHDHHIEKPELFVFDIVHFLVNTGKSKL